MKRDTIKIHPKRNSLARAGVLMGIVMGGDGVMALAGTMSWITVNHVLHLPEAALSNNIVSIVRLLLISFTCGLALGGFSGVYLLLLLFHTRLDRSLKLIFIVTCPVAIIGGAVSPFGSVALFLLLLLFIFFAQLGLSLWCSASSAMSWRARAGECDECGYDISGSLPCGICPECGSQVLYVTKTGEAGRSI